MRPPTTLTDEDLLASDDADAFGSSTTAMSARWPT
jgi:hypothetical protein